jgi:hypothetical protein
VRGNDSILVLIPLYWLLLNTKYDLDMAWVALVGVDSTVCAICAAAGFLWKYVSSMTTLKRMILFNEGYELD